MSPFADWKTSATLLGRLRHNPCDQASWNEFVERYGGLINQWCRRWGLTANDADDVTQNVLVKLASQMQGFQYDAQGSFRGWLKTIAYRAWCDFISQRSNERIASTEVLGLLQSENALESFVETLDRETQAEELSAAMALVRIRVQPHTWRAFELTALHDWPGSAVAQELGMNVGAVYVAKAKVIRMIRALLEKCD